MSSIVQKQIGISSGVVALVTTAETLAAYTGRCEANLPTLRAIVKAWALFTTGTGATGVSLRIRRGNGLTGAIVFSSIALTIGATVQTDSDLVFAESLQNVEYADYSITVQQIGASGNGVLSAASIEVEMING